MSDAASTTELDLGPLIKRFRPAMHNVIAGVILSLLFVCLGSALLIWQFIKASRLGWNFPLYVEHGDCWFIFSFFALLALFFIGIGVFFAAFVRRLLSEHAEIYANGFRYFSRQGPEDFLWNKVISIRETVLYEPIPIVRGVAQSVLPKIASRSYMIITGPDIGYGFNGNMVESMDDFSEVLRERAVAYQIPWETVEERG